MNTLTFGGNADWRRIGSVKADGEEAKARRVHREELPKLRVRHGKRRESAILDEDGILRPCFVSTERCDVEFASSVNQVVVLPPEMLGEHEKLNWLCQLFFDIDECRGVKRMTEESREMLLDAARRLLEALDFGVNPDNMIVASRWVLDFVEEANWGDDMDDGYGPKPYWRLRELAANGNKARVNAFRLKMKAVLGIDVPRVH